MAIDPICKMEVDEKADPHRSYYQGKTYYFCSAACKRSFDENPGTYASPAEEPRWKEKGNGGGFRGKSQWVIDLVKDQTKVLFTQQKNRAAEELASLARGLRQTSKSFDSERQAGISQYTGQAAEKIDQASRYFREKTLEDLVQDAGQLIRRNPAVVIGGALVLGFLVARILRSSGGGRGRREEDFRGLE